jgi:hypothetical protein
MIVVPVGDIELGPWASRIYVYHETLSSVVSMESMQHANSCYLLLNKCFKERKAHLIVFVFLLCIRITLPSSEVGGRA